MSQGNKEVNLEEKECWNFQSRMRQKKSDSQRVALLVRETIVGLSEWERGGYKMKKLFRDILE